MTSEIILRHAKYKQCFGPMPSARTARSATAQLHQQTLWPIDQSPATCRYDGLVQGKLIGKLDQKDTSCKVTIAVAMESILIYQNYPKLCIQVVSVSFTCLVFEAWVADVHLAGLGLQGLSFCNILLHMLSTDRQCRKQAN